MKLKPVNILFNILAIVTAICVCFVGFNIVSGKKGYSVVTDSMAPKINRGDVVFVEKADFSELKAGDVVTVSFPDGSGYFTHRITDIDYEALAIRTKGDANKSEDPQPSMAEQIMGRMCFSVPLLGFISIFFSSFNYIKLTVILAIAAIILVTVSTFASKAKKTKKEGDKNE